MARADCGCRARAYGADNGLRVGKREGSTERASRGSIVGGFSSSADGGSADRGGADGGKGIMPKEGGGGACHVAISGRVSSATEATCGLGGDSWCAGNA